MSAFPWSRDENPASPWFLCLNILFWKVRGEAVRGGERALSQWEGRFPMHVGLGGGEKRGRGAWRGASLGGRGPCPWRGPVWAATAHRDPHSCLGVFAGTGATFKGLGQWRAGFLPSGARSSEFCCCVWSLSSHSSGAGPCPFLTPPPPPPPRCRCPAHVQAKQDRTFSPPESRFRSSAGSWELGLQKPERLLGLRGALPSVPIT